MIYKAVINQEIADAGICNLKKKESCRGTLLDWLHLLKEMGHQHFGQGHFISTERVEGREPVQKSQWLGRGGGGAKTSN